MNGLKIMIGQLGLIILLIGRREERMQTSELADYLRKYQKWSAN